MTDLKALMRLQAWLSPAFPTGAFAYSSGLESAVELGLVGDRKSLADWLLDIIESGSAWNDAVLLAQSLRFFNHRETVDELVQLARNLSFSRERYLETIAQGSAFLDAAKAWRAPCFHPCECPLPVALGLVAGSMNAAPEATCAAFLHAYVSNQIQAALRLIRLGQNGGLEVLVHLEDPVVETAMRAAKSTIDDLGGSTLSADIASMRHETMQSRIFRS